MAKKRNTKTEMLNVDLDLVSASSLQPVLDALGENVLILHVGRRRRRHVAHLELADSHRKDADRIIKELVALVKALPRPARRAWNQATSREFNIGIQGGVKPPAHEVRISSETVSLLHSIGGALVITTYGVE